MGAHLTLVPFLPRPAVPAVPSELGMLVVLSVCAVSSVERDGSGAGRARAQVRQGPEREPRGAEVHRVCAAPVPAVHH